jgi:lipopolysaccharide export system protein LptA
MTGLGLALAVALAAAPDASTAPTAAAERASTASPGRALLSDRPVTVDAEEVRFNWKTRQVMVVGKPWVTLTHDDAVLTCRRLTGDNDATGKLVRAICEGDVKLVRADRTVTCERATYDRIASRVICTGHPVLRDAGGAEARGEKLTYDLAADEVRLETANVTIPSGQVDLATKRGGTGAP